MSAIDPSTEEQIEPDAEEQIDPDAEEDTESVAAVGLPDGWEEFHDPQQGRVFYGNRETN